MALIRLELWVGDSIYFDEEIDNSSLGYAWRKKLMESLAKSRKYKDWEIKENRVSNRGLVVIGQEDLHKISAMRKRGYNNKQIGISFGYFSGQALGYHIKKALKIA